MNVLSVGHGYTEYLLQVTFHIFSLEKQPLESHLVTVSKSGNKSRHLEWHGGQQLMMPMLRKSASAKEVFKTVCSLARSQEKLNLFFPSQLLLKSMQLLHINVN